MFPKWSPDGMKIACSSEKFAGIWVMDADGGNVRQLTDEAASGWKFAWLNNSRYIAYRYIDYFHIINGRMNQYHYLKVVNINNGNIKELHSANILNPPIILDNDLIHTIEKENKKGILYDYLGNQITNYFRKKIIYRNKDRHIVSADLDGSNEEVLITERNIDVKISPPGDKITFNKLDYIFVMDLSTKTTLDLGMGFNASWSPDGEYIIYEMIEEGEYSVIASDLYVVKADGTEKTQLTFTPDVIEQAADWSHSGDKIVFHSEHSDKLYTADIVRK
jgi:Tol biopolymer transport system component